MASGLITLDVDSIVVVCFARLQPLKVMTKFVPVKNNEDVYERDT
jgi:hypothetical protein